MYIRIYIQGKGPREGSLYIHLGVLRTLIELRNAYFTAARTRTHCGFPKLGSATVTIRELICTLLTQT